MSSTHWFGSLGAQIGRAFLDPIPGRISFAQRLGELLAPDAVLTAGGVIGGLTLMASSPGLFMPLFWVALIGNFILFFVAQNVAMKGNNSTALPLLTAYSLLTGFTLSGIVALAIGTAGIGAIGTAALATGITFVAASVVGRRMSDSIGQALSGVVGLGIIGLLIAMFWHAQLGMQVVLEDYIHESLLALVLQTAVKFVAVLGMIVSVFAVGRIALGVA